MNALGKTPKQMGIQEVRVQGGGKSGQIMIYFVSDSNPCSLSHLARKCANMPSCHCSLLFWKLTG